MFAPCQRVKVHDMLCPVVRRAAIRAMAAALALTASAACSPGSADRSTAGAGATVATEPATTTTTNPYAVPAVIDVAYVNRVLAGLDAAMGDAVRLVVLSRTLTQETYDRLRAIYDSDQWLQISLDNFQDDLSARLTSYKPVPGNKVSTLKKLISANNGCVFAEVERDYSAVATDTHPINPQWIALRPIQARNDPHGYNKTGWAYIYDGFPPNRAQPSNPCTG
jgi:outer membrane scaffolding protein for murein synthesis (MipA/OmpV family)